MCLLFLLSQLLCAYKNLPYLHSCCLWLALRQSEPFHSNHFISKSKIFSFSTRFRWMNSLQKKEKALKQQPYRLQMCGLSSVEDVWLPKATE